MDFANFASHQNTTNPNIPLTASSVAGGEEDEFDEIVPMQLDIMFDQHGHGGQHQQQQQRIEAKSLFPSSGISPLHHHHPHHRPFSSPHHHPIEHPLPIHPPPPHPSHQYPNHPQMSNYSNSQQLQFGNQTAAFGQRDQNNLWHGIQRWHGTQQQDEWPTVQMPPPRKESMPALHFNDQPLQHPSVSSSPSSQHFLGHTSSTSSPFNHHQSQHPSNDPQMEHPLERTRSLSTAIFCSTSCSTSLGPPQPHHHHHHHHYYSPSSATHSPNSMLAKADAQRRTKSTALPPPAWYHSNQQTGASLRRFHSQLRSPRHYSPSGAPLLMAAPLPALKPYTPPPILSPMRSGSGLFHRIARNDRKSSSLTRPNIDDNFCFGESEHHQKHCQKETERGEPTTATEATMADEAVADEEEEGRGSGRKEHNGGSGGVPPPMIMTTMVGGQQQKQQNEMEADEEEEEEEEEQNGMMMTEKRKTKKRTTEGDEDDEDRGMKPQRKNGFLFSGDGPSSSGLTFAAELEQLRKQSSASGKSHKASFVRMSIKRNKLSMPSDDFIRKMSSVSMDEARADEAGSDEVAPESDAIPHINLGKNYQTRVKKWADRAISAQERAAIPDRDELVFESRTIDHIPQSALAAYETLACSVAVPKPGRNKELALHILAENQGNLQAAVMDLLRCDTLDWEQYPNIYNSLYVDVDDWSPEEINSFQDGIYKSEKDFQQMAAELGNRSVRECVAFYYTWKKACPDDYRKLRNLRKKRQLLEQQLDFVIPSCRQPHQSESHRDGASSEEVDEDDEFSETESDITNPSLMAAASSLSHHMDCSPIRKQSLPRAHLPPSTGGHHSSDHHSSPLVPHHPSASSSSLLAPSTSLFNGSSNSGYPWIHGDMFPSPSSSSTSTTDHHHPFAGSGDPMSATDGGAENGHGLHQHSSNNGFGHHQHNKIRSATVATKKGAQPSADGFFHCRLCEKRFEKVKSLNAHMKSHAMKARAEAEAQMQQKQHATASGLAFPTPTKKDINDNNNTHNHNHSSSSSSSLGGPLNLTSSQAAMAAAALTNLNRQIQQQQAAGTAGGAATMPGGIMGSNLLLRNMLQYGQQQAAAAAAAQSGGGAGWPTNTHHQNHQNNQFNDT